MNAVILFLTRRRKTMAALASSAVAWGWVVTASPSGPVSAGEWMAGAVLLLGALGVHTAVNEPT